MDNILNGWLTTALPAVREVTQPMPITDADRIQRIRHSLIRIAARWPSELAELDEIEERLLMVEDRIAQKEDAAK